MRKFITAVIVLLTTVSFNASAWDLKDILKNVGSGSADSTSTSTGSGALDAISSIAGALGLGGKFTLADLTGTWTYQKPAVTFLSDNLLLKAGGAAAASTVEDKLVPYYKMAGITNLKMTFNSDSTFVMKLKVGSLKGTLSQSDDGKQLYFNFQALGRINIGTMEAYISTQGLKKNQVAITFDVSKLMTILEKAGSLTGNSTIKGITSILEKYDGLTAGFMLSKTSSATR